MILQVTRWLSIGLTAATCCTLIAIIAGEVAIHGVGLPDMTRLAARSQLVTDRDGRILWGFLAPDQRWRLPTKPEDVDPQYLQRIIAYEDGRFYEHCGVDVIAFGRALWQAARAGRVVSGASTITMQTVRLLEPKPRTLATKLEEMLKAIKLERTLSKHEILSIYLTLAPFGGNIEGVRAASLTYFGKEPKKLSPPEAALLIGLPQSPEALRPDRNPARARAAADAVLRRIAARTGERTAPLARLPRIVSQPLTRVAPHLAQRLHRALPSAETIRTTIDGELQAKAEEIARAAVRNWGEGVNSAMIVVRLADMSVAAYVGAADFFDDRSAGQVDLVQAVRSPGSALKPFIFGMAFERLIVHPDTVITDEAVEYDGYEPENFDGGFGGDMKVRMALIRSVNTAAVSLLKEVGPANFMARLRSVGAPLQIQDSDAQAGLAIALGGGGMTLANLTRLYAGLGRNGQVAPLRFRPEDPLPVGAPLVSPAAARAVTDVLADIQPSPGFARRTSLNGGRRIAFKTGTSYGFRDAWAVGYDRNYAVGVWIGRPDGSPHLGAYGITAAAPVMLKVFDLLPVPPEDVAQTGVSLGSLASPRELPERLKRYRVRDAAGAEVALAIDFPKAHAVVGLDKAEPDAAVPLKVRGGTPPYQWYVDGEPWQSVPTHRARWHPPSSGQYDVLVVDANGRSARSQFWVE